MKAIPGRRVPRITAHAGCMDTLPNTRESLLAAFASEADIVEVDLRLSRDGVAVLAHDECLALPGRGLVPLRDLGWAQIARRSASEASPMLSLEDFFGIARERGQGKMLNLDIKENLALGPAASLVSSLGMERSVVFSGLDTEGIRLASERLSGLSYCFNADALMPESAGGARDAEAACGLALERGCCGINLEWSRATEYLVTRAHDRGLLVMLWTADTEAAMRIALDFRPDSITTNYPDLLARLIDSRLPPEGGRGP